MKQDSSWRKILDKLLPQFLAFFFREIYKAIDFAKGFEFPLVKLLDYRRKWDELQHDPNPFALATMAFLKTVETQGNAQKRYKWKKHFLLEMYRRGMSREMPALPQARDRGFV